jgi:hypothetical protein
MECGSAVFVSISLTDLPTLWQGKRAQNAHPIANGFKSLTQNNRASASNGQVNWLFLTPAFF